MNQTRKRFIKLVIFFTVVVGLWGAAQKASQQWQDQSQQAKALIQEIDEQLKIERQGVERKRLAEKRATLSRSLPEIRNFDGVFLILAVFFYGFGLMPSGLLLDQATRTFGHRPPLDLSLAAQTIGHIGKYVPGKALVVVLRASVLGRAGVPFRDSTLCIFIETLMMMAVGGSLSAAVLLWLPLPSWILWLAILAAIGSSIPTFPPVLQWIIEKIATGRENQSPRGGSETRAENLEQDDVALNRFHAYRHSQGMQWRLFGVGWLLSIWTWLLFGLSFACIIMSVPTANPIPFGFELMAISTAAISLAIVAGFASLLPGGAGVRELVLASILGVLLSPSHGLIAAILARLVHLAVEVCFASLAWIWITYRFPNAQASAQSSLFRRTGEYR